MTTFYGRCEIVTYCPSSFSLKDKRKTLQSLLDRIQDKLNLAVAEVDHQDRHRLSRLAFATVGSSRDQVDRIFGKLEGLIDEDPTLQIREIERSIS